MKQYKKPCTTVVKIELSRMIMGSYIPSGGETEGPIGSEEKNWDDDSWNEVEESPSGVFFIHHRNAVITLKSF